ncbi:MAG: hypothetical protein DPW18_20395 [Chloroflexi bacterium]|nr:hypothetical protein Rctr41k_52 [Virus Rctr41k]MCQ3939379.1 hypothetical protein [Chloroflexota bacterium]
MYQSGLASLFSTYARQNPAYKIHKDRPNNKWNVFRLECGRENFVRAFDDLAEAQAFAGLTPLCTGTDPIRCDDPNCPAHGKRA